MLKERLTDTISLVHSRGHKHDTKTPPNTQLAGTQMTFTLKKRGELSLAEFVRNKRGMTGAEGETHAPKETPRIYNVGRCYNQTLFFLTISSARVTSTKHCPPPPVTTVFRPSLI